MVLRISLIFISMFSLILSSPVTAAENFLFRGQIVDTANQPVKGAEVYIFNSKDIKRPADFISNRTGSDGYYRVELPPGKYWTLAIMRLNGATFGPLGKDDKHSGEPVETTTPENGEIIQDFTIMDLQDAARANRKHNEDIVKVSGQILDLNGNPVAMAYVMADANRKSAGLPHYISTWTDADGAYTIFLPMGKIFLGAARAFPPDNDYSLEKEAILGEDTGSLNLIVK